eukprot:gene31055-38952_t
MLTKRPPPRLHEVTLREEAKRDNNRSMVDAWVSSIEGSEVLDLEMSEWLGEDVHDFHQGIKDVAQGPPSCDDDVDDADEVTQSPRRAPGSRSVAKTSPRTVEPMPPPMSEPMKEDAVSTGVLSP